MILAEEFTLTCQDFKDSQPGPHAMCCPGCHSGNDVMMEWRPEDNFCRNSKTVAVLCCGMTMALTLNRKQFALALRAQRRRKLEERKAPKPQIPVNWHESVVRHTDPAPGPRGPAGVGSGGGPGGVL